MAAGCARAAETAGPLVGLAGHVRECRRAARLWHALTGVRRLRYRQHSLAVVGHRRAASAGRERGPERTERPHGCASGRRTIGRTGAAPHVGSDRRWSAARGRLPARMVRTPAGRSPRSAGSLVDRPPERGDPPVPADRGTECPMMPGSGGPRPVRQTCRVRSRSHQGSRRCRCAERLPPAVPGWRGCAEGTGRYRYPPRPRPALASRAPTSQLVASGLSFAPGFTGRGRRRRPA